MQLIIKGATPTISPSTASLNIIMYIDTGIPTADMINAAILAHCLNFMIPIPRKINRIPLAESYGDNSMTLLSIGLIKY